MLKLKRAYDPSARSDGTRVLVERLWPRGRAKSALQVDAWLRDVGPSTRLRQWFNHDPRKWATFRARYFRELDPRPDAWRPVVAAARHGTVTLVYSSHDTKHNNAVALKDYLNAKMGRRDGDFQAYSTDARARPVRRVVVPTSPPISIAPHGAAAVRRAAAPTPAPA